MNQPIPALKTIVMDFSACVLIKSLLGQYLILSVRNVINENNNIIPS